MRQTLRLGKKQKVAKFGYALLVQNTPGDVFRPVGGVHASRYLAEQYYHQKVATSVTVRKYRIEGIRVNVDKEPYIRRTPSEANGK